MNPVSSRIYARMLQFYPDDLRQDYAAEMLILFAEDLAASPGVRGACRVWRCALSEFCRFALPAQVRSTRWRVAAISIVLFATMLAVFVPIALLQPPAARPLFNAVSAAFLLPLFATPAISLAAVWACRDHEVISLEI